jgi:hypothetical protein
MEHLLRRIRKLVYIFLADGEVDVDPWVTASSDPAYYSVIDLAPHPVVFFEQSVQTHPQVVSTGGQSKGTVRTYNGSEESQIPGAHHDVLDVVSTISPQEWLTPGDYEHACAQTIKRLQVTHNLLKRQIPIAQIRHHAMSAQQIAPIRQDDRARQRNTVAVNLAASEPP